jgi:restriction endonuclease S subunit
VTSFDAVQNQRTGLVRFFIDDEGHKKLIKLALTLFERDYVSRGKGIGVQNVSAKDIEKTEVPLPPLREQRRIVAKIDSLSAKSRRSCSHLNHIPRLVEKYKQAILTAAYADAQRHSDQPVMLGSIAIEVRNGLSKKPFDEPPGLPILRISAVRPLRVHLQDTPSFGKIDIRPTTVSAYSGENEIGNPPRAH